MIKFYCYRSTVCLTVEFHVVAKRGHASAAYSHSQTIIGKKRLFGIKRSFSPSPSNKTPSCENFSWNYIKRAQRAGKMKRLANEIEVVVS